MKKWMCRYSTKRVACSDLDGEYFFGKGNFLTIDNGVDIDKFMKMFVMLITKWMVQAQICIDST